MKILFLTILLSLSSCSIYLTDEQPDLINENSCKLSCTETNKIYINYDKDIACKCQEK